jgi:CRP-like cAMP-binding protein
MTEIEGLNRLLKEHPFFKGMDPVVSQTLAGCAMNERFNVGEYLFREGGAADKFYLIRHGSVALEVHVPGHEAFVVETLGEGDILGWSWLVPPYKWVMDARAAQLVRAISLDVTCLRGKLDSDHTLGYEVFKRFIPVMADRLEAGRLQMIDMYGHSRTADMGRRRNILVSDEQSPDSGKSA